MLTILTCHHTIRKENRQTALYLCTLPEGFKADRVIMIAKAISGHLYVPSQFTGNKEDIMTTCHNCQDNIDQDEINTLNKTLIFAIDAGLEEFSDLEEAMYHGMYCAKCCKEFIAAEAAECK